MASTRFERLFTPISLRRVEIRNRILSTGHQTCLARANVPGEDLVAYHDARAKGGVGLIVTESARFHETSVSSSPDLQILTDDCIPAFRTLAEAVHRHGARIFGQLSHAGRLSRRMRDGLRGVTYAPSSVPDRRFQSVPREMPTDLVEELVQAAGEGARRYAEAGYDGVELLASHGLLFAQFLNPVTNHRSDRYGGSLENRMRFLSESLAAIRKAVGEDRVVGMRISIDEIETDGLSPEDVTAICRALCDLGALDYVNVTAGSMAGLGGSIHVVPPMEVETAYVAPQAGSLRDALGVPVFVAGRINQPQIAERVLASGLADMCGMTRAMIADPEMPRKASLGKVDEIRACIGCNQACIGHFHQGNAISCIQDPRTGREARHITTARCISPKFVLVVGGGPAGMKAAVTAAQRGHRVKLAEAERVLGGQALLAQCLPERAEFGGLITNLMQELIDAGVEVATGLTVDVETIFRENPESVIIATGAVPLRNRIETDGSAHILNAEDILSGRNKARGSVLIADSRCDWVGIGTAVHLAANGHRVRLAVDGICAGQNLPAYVRDIWAGKLHDRGVEVIPYARIFGADSETAFLTHSITGAPILCEEVGTIICANLYSPRTELENALHGIGKPVVCIGDCMSPRTAEEAIYDGFLAGLEPPGLNSG